MTFTEELTARLEAKQFTPDQIQEILDIAKLPFKVMGLNTIIAKLDHNIIDYPSECLDQWWEAVQYAAVIWINTKLGIGMESFKRYDKVGYLPIAKIQEECCGIDNGCSQDDYDACHIHKG